MTNADADSSPSTAGSRSPPDKPIASREDETLSNGLGTYCRQYKEEILAVSGTTPRILELLSKRLLRDARRRKAFLQEFSSQSDTGEANIPFSHFHIFSDINKRIVHAGTAIDSLSRSSLVSMISSYDSLLARLLSIAVRTRQYMLDSKDRKISISDLMQFSQLEDAIDHAVDELVDSVLRDNHDKQAEWISKNLNFDIRNLVHNWAGFLEACERRNVLVHNEAVASKQYRKRCKLFNVPDQEIPQEGESLEVTPEYLEQSRDILLEIGIILSVNLWERVFPKDKSSVESFLVDICYDLICTGAYTAACSILSSSLRHRRWEDERSRLVCMVNLAQSHKWNGRDSDAARTLDELNPSVLAIDFQIAIAVLREEWQVAANLLPQLAAFKSFRIEYFAMWPLFRHFRETVEFSEAFELHYGRSFGALMAEQDSVTKRIDEVANMLDGDPFD